MVSKTQGNINYDNAGRGTKPVHDLEFSDIGEQDTAIKKLKETLQFLLNLEEAVHMEIRPLKGVLLVGPPGRGKTLLARTAALVELM